jgi:hypothetical protein
VNCPPRANYPAAGPASAIGSKLLPRARPARRVFPCLAGSASAPQGLSGPYLSPTVKFTTEVLLELTETDFSQVRGSEKMGRSTFFSVSTSYAPS